MDQLRLKRAFEEGYRNRMQAASSQRSSGFGADPAYLLNALGRAASCAAGNGHNVSSGQTQNVHTLKQLREQARVQGAGNGKV